MPRKRNLAFIKLASIRIWLRAGPPLHPLIESFLIGEGFDVRRKSDLSWRIKVICPVQSCCKKYSASPPTQITSRTAAVLSHSEGRLAIVTNAGQDAVDADAPITNGA
jgi:hypothetical protein